MMMPSWTSESSQLLDAALSVMSRCGYELTWTIGPQGITTFHTLDRRPGSLSCLWYDWDATMGKQDLAFLVAMTIGMEEPL